MPTQNTDLAKIQADPFWRDSTVTNLPNVAAPYSSDREKAIHRQATAIYTATGSETTGDTINLLSLPIGSIVIPDSGKVITDGVGGTGAITALGDAGSSTRYFSGSIAVASAGVNAVSSANTTAIAATNPPYQVVTGNETLTATLTLSSALSAGKVIVFRIAYILP